MHSPMAMKIRKKIKRRSDLCKSKISHIIFIKKKRLMKKAKCQNVA
jgi:hypothetical protein